MSEINALSIHCAVPVKEKEPEKTSAKSHVDKMILPSNKNYEMQQLCHFKFPFSSDELESVQFGVTIKMKIEIQLTLVHVAVSSFVVLFEHK